MLKPTFAGPVALASPLVGFIQEQFDVSPAFCRRHGRAHLEGRARRAATWLATEWAGQPGFATERGPSTLDRTVRPARTQPGSWSDRTAKPSEPSQGRDPIESRGRRTQPRS